MVEELQFTIVIGKEACATCLSPLEWLLIKVNKTFFLYVNCAAYWVGLLVCSMSGNFYEYLIGFHLCMAGLQCQSKKPQCWRKHLSRNSLAGCSVRLNPKWRLAVLWSLPIRTKLVFSGQGQSQLGQVYYSYSFFKTFFSTKLHFPSSEFQ